MQKLTKWALRIWITLASTVAFAAGWYALAQTEVIYQAQTEALDPAASAVGEVLSPVPSVDDLSSGDSGPGFTIVVSAPTLRTGGS